MPELIYHAMGRQADDLRARMRAVLAQLQHSEARVLIDRLDEPRRRIPVIGLTGQYSSGKSMLINALTDGQAGAEVGADVTTDVARVYDWDGHLDLVDTPGVQAGMPMHDLEAIRAIASAELVVFAITPQLFDDAAVEHLHEVADRLGKREQMLIVMNKKAQMSAAPGVREAAVAEACGPGWEPTFVECDARSYLEALAADPNERAALVDLSGIDQVREAINRLASQVGNLAGNAQPFQVIQAVALDARVLVTVDEDEGRALRVLARQQAALVAARQSVELAVDEAAEEFVRRSQDATELFADEIDSADDMSEWDRPAAVDKAQKALATDLDAGALEFGQHIERGVKRAADALSQEYAEVAGSEQGQWLIAIGELDAKGRPSASATWNPSADNVSSGAGQLPPWLPDAQRLLQEFGKHWGAGAGKAASSGTLGHDAVKQVGHLFNVKFKPWQAVRVANNIGRAVKVASVAITVASVVHDVVSEERAKVALQKKRDARRRALVREVAIQAEGIVRAQREAVNEVLAPFFNQTRGEIEHVRNEILSTGRERTEIQREIDDVLRECANHLMELQPRA